MTNGSHSGTLLIVSFVVAFKVCQCALALIYWGFPFTNFFGNQQQTNTHTQAVSQSQKKRTFKFVLNFGGYVCGPVDVAVFVCV